MKHHSFWLAPIYNSTFSLQLSIVLFLTGLMTLAGCTSPSGNGEKKPPVELNNPILPGYFADPSLVQYDGKFYLYVTADPWGGDSLSCWVSDDFRNWTFHQLNWPTKEACTSPTSRPNKVWAPSVVRHGDAFYMYISVGSEVWCGKASHPLGPWENMLGDRPMIPDDPTGYYHVIDAEAFIDDDGKAYLYWGSGWEWINGHCFAAELNEDMSSFKTEPVEITPSRYFEGPFMIKHNGNYFLTYSEGKTIDETYEVRYAIGDNPFGPFTEASNSPVLTKNDSLHVYGPGHHTLFSLEGKSYILYHRHRLPFVSGSAFRQTCITEYSFNEAGDEINTIIPYPNQLFPDLSPNNGTKFYPESIVATSQADEWTVANNISDNHYSTRWEADPEDRNPEITMTFHDPVPPGNLEIRFEYPWKKYFIKVESIEKSADNGSAWVLAADYTKTGISGSPVIIPLKNRYQQVRISFIDSPDAALPAIWEVTFN